MLQYLRLFMGTPNFVSVDKNLIFFGRSLCKSISPRGLTTIDGKSIEMQLIWLKNIEYRPLTFGEIVRTKLN